MIHPSLLSYGVHSNSVSRPRKQTKSVDKLNNKQYITPSTKKYYNEKIVTQNSLALVAVAVLPKGFFSGSKLHNRKILGFMKYDTVCNIKYTMGL